MSAAEAADAIERGVLSVYSDATTIKIPMADGGEGTVDALVASTNGRIVEKEATNPLGVPIKGKYGILGDEKTAVIEMASVSGLPLVPENKRNPLNTTTYGTGELIADALNAGCRNLIIGIGGSATNDCGTGMAQALGIKFLRPNGTEITQPMCGGLLTEIEKIDTTQIHPAVTESFITVACDVDNPLLGQKGCAHVYAPQKGATPEIVEKLENDMQKFADVLENETGRNVRNYPGAGAAGGLGAGLMAFLKAELKPGIELVLKASDFAHRIKGADLILTGEGKLDYQTAYGKTISGICSVAKKQGIPVIAFAGTIEPAPNLYDMGLKSYFSICDGPKSLEQAMKDAPVLLENITERVMRILSI